MTSEKPPVHNSSPSPKKKQLKNFVTSSHVTALLEAGTQEKRILKWVFFIVAS
jgi:hypothetical protein